MRVLLISTYELGHQPLHVASPARRLLDAGHEVKALDLAVEPYDRERVEWAEAIGVSVPMHTAMRLAVPLVRRIRQELPKLPLAFYGLYAAMNSDPTVENLVDRAIVGEYEMELARWIDELEEGGERSPSMIRDLSVQSFGVPAREMLPGLDEYAHLQVGSEHRLVGYTEASHGCRHRCRHCPIPAVYDGLFRIVGVESVLSDVHNLVEMGARHITFGDPDFLNGPAYALRVLDAVHSEFDDLSFDLTVKVEHLLNHADIIPKLSDLNVLFVVSAFETVSDHVLGLLDKGHSAAEMSRAVEMCRDHGIDIHPSWLPFTPWTTHEEILGIFDFISDHDLVDVTDPVQLSIRLLIPAGSLVLDLAEVAPYLGSYDSEALGYRWRASDPAMDQLQVELAQIAAHDADAGVEGSQTLVSMWRQALAAAGEDESLAQIPAGAVAGRPRLTEPWFC